MTADALIGSVLITGARAPMLVTRDMLSSMPKGSIIVDVAVDQGGCVETTKPTTHSDPTFVIDGVLHYGVTNMPGAVPRTSSLALANATLPYTLKIADRGAADAMRADPALLKGLNTAAGRCTHPAVAETFRSRICRGIDRRLNTSRHRCIAAALISSQCLPPALHAS